MRKLYFPGLLKQMVWSHPRLSAPMFLVHNSTTHTYTYLPALPLSLSLTHTHTHRYINTDTDLRFFSYSPFHIRFPWQSKKKKKRNWLNTCTPSLKYDNGLYFDLLNTLVFQKKWMNRHYRLVWLPTLFYFMSFRQYSYKGKTNKGTFLSIQSASKDTAWTSNI